MYSKLQLVNGLKIVINPQPSTAAATILVMVPVGSRFERKSIAGLSHFTEHMMFKGTKKRPDTLSISQELDSIGADYNAFTAKEYTGYYIKAQASQLPLAIDILSDMLRNSKFDANEIEREKRVIIEEINMYEDNPMMILDDVFDSLAYKGNTLARDVAGSKETIATMTKDDFVKFVGDYYMPDNMLVSISGQVDVDKVARLLERKFKARKGKVGFPKEFNKFTIRQNKPRVYIKKKKTEQVHLALGFVNRVGYRSKILLPLQLANIVLGGNMSSRLFINIREREGLCYYIRSKINTFADGSNFTIYAGLDKSRLEKAIELIMKELTKLKERGITSKEVKKVKEYVQGKLILSLEDSAHVSQWYAEKWLLNKKIETPEEFLARLKNIKQVEVNRALKLVLKENFLNLVLIGNLKDTRPFRNLLHF